MGLAFTHEAHHDTAGLGGLPEAFGVREEFHRGNESFRNAVVAGPPPLVKPLAI